MNISSRTPDGQFNHCPVCRQEICITPSEPTGDAPCPHCGVLLWFLDTVHGIAFFQQADRPGKPPISDIVKSQCDVEFVDVEIGAAVRIKEGTFESFEGRIASFDFDTFKVTVVISIFGRETPVELEFWQVESA